MGSHALKKIAYPKGLAKGSSSNSITVPEMDPSVMLCAAHVSISVV